MRGTTHLLFGLVLAAVFTQVHSFANPLLAVVLILLGSLLPDLDERHSTLGRKVPIVGFLIKHRTFFHSLLFLVAVTILLWAVVPAWYVIAFAAAVLGHLFLDALTPQGVRPFWPSKLRVRGFVRTGGVLEKLVAAAAVVAFVWLLLR